MAAPAQKPQPRSHIPVPRQLPGRCGIWVAMKPEDDMASQMPLRQTGRTDPAAVSVDLWLRQNLSARFGSTLSEPLPDDLLLLAIRLQ